MSDLIDTLVYGENETVLPTGKQLSDPVQREKFTVKDPLDSVLGVSAGEGPGRADGDPDHDLIDAVEEARGKALRPKRALSTLIRISAERGREALPVPKSDVIPLPQTYRNSAGEFLPGKPGGPGRPAAFGNWAKLARLLSGDGLEVMAFAFGVLRGEITHYQFHPKTGELVEMEASPALKWEIAKWIKEQGFGKEVERFDVTSGGEKLGSESEEAPDLSQLTTDEVRQYLSLRMKAIRRGAVTVGSGSTSGTLGIGASGGVSLTRGEGLSEQGGPGGGENQGDRTALDLDRSEVVGGDPDGLSNLGGNEVSGELPQSVNSNGGHPNTVKRPYAGVNATLAALRGGT